MLVVLRTSAKGGQKASENNIGVALRLVTEAKQATFSGVYGISIQAVPSRTDLL